MTTKQVGARLVELCKKNRNVEAVKELYAADVTTAEAWDGQGMPRVMTGMDAVLKKHDWWDDMVETHSGEVEGPFFHGDDQFGAIFTMDVTMKAENQRMQMRELAIYTVKDGKIVKEQFFNVPMA